MSEDKAETPAPCAVSVDEWIEDEVDERFPWKDEKINWGRVRIRAMKLATDAVDYVLKSAETPAKQPYVSESGAVHSEAGVSRPGLSVKCAAETPAPTCKRPLCVACGDCPGHDDEPVARDASGDAPLWNHEQYDEEIAALNKALRSEVASVDRLHAELAKANARVSMANDLIRTLKEACDQNGVKHDELRAELAAAKKRVTEALGQIDADRIRHFNECKERDEEIARLREEVETREAWHERLIDRLCDTLQIEDAEDIDSTVAAVAKLRVEELAATTAKLGRAVAALRDANEANCKGQFRSWPVFCQLQSNITSTLADADGTQAAAYVNELEAVYEAVKAYRNSVLNNTGTTVSFKDVADALAAVDARRGAVKP